MTKHLNLADRAFLVITGTVAGLGFVLSERDFESLFLYWSAYFLAMSLVGMFRLGLERGMAIPTFAIAVVGISHPAILAPCLSIWFLAPILYSVMPAAKAVIRRLKPFVTKRLGDSAPELVSVAVRGQTSDVSAADVLAQFGFEQGD